LALSTNRYYQPRHRAGFLMSYLFLLLSIFSTCARIHQESLDSRRLFSFARKAGEAVPRISSMLFAYLLSRNNTDLVLSV
jgi:hypothetical protein